MAKITFLGACREVGRSAILIESKSGEKCIFDYGIRFTGEERFPYEANLNGLKALAFTHCHIDHSGALPYLYKNMTIPVFTNPVSLEITKILIKDMLRIANFHFPFGLGELDKMIKHSYFLECQQRQKIGENFYITFFNAGHIPGSVSILIEVDNKNILYSGDINTKPTNLVEISNSHNSQNFPLLDALIMESTYALKRHPPREELEKDFFERIINTTENGGSVLIPSFGVARSQEALLILQKYNYNGKVYIDGLTKIISNIYLEHPESIRNIKLYKKALDRAQFVSRKRRRTIAKNAKGVIIAPSGMLKGGAAISFLKSILNDPASAIYLIGYQVEGSPGRTLLDHGFLQFNEYKERNNFENNVKIKAKCDYDYFDFSSHADSKQLMNFVEVLKFKNDSENVFCIHGDSKATTKFSSELAKKGYNSIAPEIGEIYDV
jgi:putative mRNA 3-end processing factor